MEPARDLFDATPQLPDDFTRWFASRGWQPRAHQLELLAKQQLKPVWLTRADIESNLERRENVRR